MMDDGTFGAASAVHRLPAATRVGPVRLQVTSLDQSVDYYTKVLGFAVHARGADLATLAPHGHDAQPLLFLEERRDAKPVPPGGLLGLYHFAILLPDRAHLGRFVRHLASLGVRIAAADHLVSEALYLWDPDGLGIEVYADRPRDTWRSRDGELVMTTDPLDLASLARAAGADAWNGMPPGTTMGHVHLSVGDVGAARAFYHTALGLDQTVWSYPGALFLSAGGYHHHLGLNTWSAHTRPAGDLDARLLEWTLILPSAGDVVAASAGLEGAGYNVLADGAARLVADPWQTRIKLAARGS
jgi:catechol 2,3-dioxygenase